MQIPFHKYHGTGNDFILIDNRQQQYLDRSSVDSIRHLCNRRFGIGADGLMLLQSLEGYDFEMVYFNADGRESSMCGNGGRCITAFAQQLGILQDQQAHFLAIDGPHAATLQPNGWVELKMIDVASVEMGQDYYLLDTGSPHYVVFVEDLDDINIVENGQAIRYSKRFREEGVNVNFVELKGNGIEVATYERGVEGETYSCGTGVCAAAIAYQLYRKDTSIHTVDIQTKGGPLRVRFDAQADGSYQNLWLCGPATKVFEGQCQL